MLRRMNWPLIGFFLVAAALPIAAFIQEFVFNRCSAAVLSEIAKDKPTFGCGEFFLNRYQSIIAALIGAGVAVYVVRPVFRQLRTMNRQTAAQLMERAELQARELESERDAVRDFAETISRSYGLLELYNESDPEWAHQHWHKSYYALLESLRAKAQVVVAAELRGDPGGIETESRTAFANHLAVLEKATRDLSFAFISLTSGHDPAEVEDCSPEQCNEAEAFFRAAVPNAEEAFRKYAMQHTRAVKAAWARRNRLAADAFG